MPYQLLVDVTAAVHFAFVAYVVVGGFIAWRWPRTVWLHVLAVSWGFSTVLFGFACPLTYLENWARLRAGDAGLPSSGFIDHYLTGVIYPESALGLVRVLVVACIVLSWAGLIWLTRQRGHHRVRPST
ncbi:DUF2784 domain-containing protein [Nocardia australiensis]|uniref:DUF2784 domain-containing protein n=1 Tax=Nocardia australiensis TaxID=2887191 RepID=UPI001D15294E|nr:DUF2784 domain-containing protein [Nocardia australiensis]